MATTPEGGSSPLALSTHRYPRGWFQISFSHEVNAGELKLVKYFGRDIVIFRTESGKLGVIDAYCQHLGQNLGVRGRVSQEDIVCPWHGWHWDVDGNNTLIPYSTEKCKDHVKIEKWTHREWYGLILVWHDPEGQTEPDWEPPKIPLLEEGRTYPIREQDRFTHRIKAHPQMVLENGCDPFHIHWVHGGSENHPEPVSFETDQHTFRVKIMVSYGDGLERTQLTPNGPIRVPLQLRQYGIGIGFVLFPPELLEAIQLSCVTPVDEVYSDYNTTLAAAREPGDTGDMPINRAAAFTNWQKRVVVHDFFTWENMKYLEKPNFAREEAKNYSAVRHWSRQFYPPE